MKTTSTSQLRRAWLVTCFVLLTLAGFSQTHVSFSLQNCSSTTNTVSYDLYIVNDGSTALRLAAASYGVIYSSTILNGGTPGTTAYTFNAGTRDVALTGLNSYTVNHTLSSNQLRLTMSPQLDAGTAPALPTGLALRVGRFTFTNTTPWASSSNPAFFLKMVAQSGFTQTTATVYIDGATTTTALNQEGTTTAGSVNCAITLNGISCAVAAAASSNTPPVCLGGNNGSIIITLSGAGTTPTGTYSLDGGGAIPYATNPFTVSGLSAGAHSLVATTTTPCTSNTVAWTTGAGADPNDGNVCTLDACDNSPG